MKIPQKYLKADKDTLYLYRYLLRCFYVQQWELWRDKFEGYSYKDYMWSINEICMMDKLIHWR